MRYSVPTVLRTFLNSELALTGGIVQRDRDFVDRNIGREMLVREVQARGWHLVMTKSHYAVICTSNFTQLA